MILIICQEIGLIELFKRSFSRSERSGLTHFPISILFSSNEVLPYVLKLLKRSSSMSKMSNLDLCYIFGLTSPKLCML